MSPLVDVFGPGFDGSDPSPVLFDHQHAQRGNNAQHFLVRNLTWGLGDQKIDQVVGVRQMVSGQMLK